MENSRKKEVTVYHCEIRHFLMPLQLILQLQEKLKKKFKMGLNK